MDYKLLAIDMDDTLLPEGLKISERTIKAIKKAQNHGVKVVIATGRMFCSALPYLKEMNLTAESITYNGALLKEIGSGEILDHQPVPLDLALEIVDLVKEEDLYLNMYLDDILYSNKLGFGADYYEQISGIKPVLVKEDISQFLDKPPTKLLIIEKVAKIEEIFTSLEDKFGAKLNITRSKPRFIEIMKKGISKGVTLSKLADQLGFSAEEVVAIGDSLNDLEMIQYAGLGVAVDNAREEIKEEADYVTKSNDEEGVAELIENVILKA